MGTEKEVCNISNKKSYIILCHFANINLLLTFLLLPKLPNCNYKSNQRHQMLPNIFTEMKIKEDTGEETQLKKFKNKYVRL